MERPAESMVALESAAAPSEIPSERAAIVDRLLRAAREHLGLDVAFIGEFVRGQRVFRHVSAAPGAEVIQVGGSDPLDESYCAHVVSGRLPQFLADAGRHPFATRLSATRELPVGSHLSVPIRLPSGRLYGTFCCFGFAPNDSLGEHDLRALRMIADLAAEQLDAIDALQREAESRRALIVEVLEDPKAMSLVFQPLRDLRTLEIIGVEALTRFPGRSGGPAWFFSQAAEAGLGTELEMRAVRSALAVLDDIPPPIRLNVNVSPETLCSRAFSQAVRDVGPDRLVVEVTEQFAVEDYTEMKKAVAFLAERRIWLAIDDFGMGFSGIERILESSPQELKLDAVVTQNVHVDPIKQAMIEAFCGFGRRAGFNVVAEGIETQDELAALRVLGARLGQGYHLGRPGPLADVLDAST